MIGLFQISLLLAQGSEDRDYVSDALLPQLSTDQKVKDQSSNPISFDFNIKDSNIDLNFKNSSNKSVSRQYVITYYGPNREEVASEKFFVNIPANGAEKRFMTMPAGAVGFEVKELSAYPKKREEKNKDEGKEVGAVSSSPDISSNMDFENIAEPYEYSESN